MKQILSDALGIKVVIKKRRKIFFIENVKFHIDEVEELGGFVEIEATNKNFPDKTIKQLQQQCNAYMQQLNIKKEDLICNSYSDMVKAK